MTTRTAPDILTLPERLRVHAARGGGHISAEYLREIADAIDAASEAADLAEDMQQSSLAAYDRALSAYGKANIICAISIVINLTTLAYIFWIAA